MAGPDVLQEASTVSCFFPDEKTSVELRSHHERKLPDAPCDVSQRQDHHMSGRPQGAAPTDYPIPASADALKHLQRYLADFI